MERNVLEDKKPCACGCGIMISLTDNRGRSHDFVSGHSARKMKQETKNKIRASLRGKIGPESRGWKGDNITKSQLHHWIRRYFPPPQLCQFCLVNKPYDLANITRIYNRDLKNWKYLCRPCHAGYDDYVRKAWVTRKKLKTRTITQ